MDPPSPEELGLSQRDLDEATSYSYAYVSRIESGARTLSLSAVIQFGAALDTSASTAWLRLGGRSSKLHSRPRHVGVL